MNTTTQAKKTKIMCGQCNKKEATITAEREVGFGYTIKIVDLCKTCAKKWGMK